jgi:hypothetical protein
MTIFCNYFRLYKKYARPFELQLRAGASKDIIEQIVFYFLYFLMTQGGIL